MPEIASGHVTVLLDETVDALQPMACGVYVDGTFGGGGHTRRLLEKAGAGATVYALDADPAAIARAQEMMPPEPDQRVIPLHANFRDLASVLPAAGVTSVDGMLFDLGLSSYQLDEAERGFAFRFDGPLDMRFDPSRGVNAADIVNTWSPQEIAQVLWQFGEEQRSRQIARAIEARRAQRPFKLTSDLAEVIERAVGGRRGKAIHPATKSFQALRIAVNDELTSLRRMLDAAMPFLRPGGRLAVISFHSLEDRIVKQFMAQESQTCVCPPDQPVCTCDHKARLRRIGKPIKPTARELELNPRSRSAILRVTERCLDE